MYEKPPALFLVSFGVLYNDIMLSAVMPIAFGVFSWFCSISRELFYSD